MTTTGPDDTLSVALRTEALEQLLDRELPPQERRRIHPRL